jgi:hypothetical protein
VASGPAEPEELEGLNLTASAGALQDPFARRKRVGCPAQGFAAVFVPSVQSASAVRGNRLSAQSASRTAAVSLTTVGRFSAVGGRSFSRHRREFYQMDEKRFKLEDQIEMLRYSIDAMERQRDGFAPGCLEWHYAQKIIDSCRAQLAEKEKELGALTPPSGDSGEPR